MKQKLVTIGLAAAFALSSLGLALLEPAPAAAAPITCPSGQTAKKTSSGWKCVNNGGHPTGAGRHKGTGDKT